jgi:hypothetical protein
MFRAGGILFDVQPEGALTSEELGALARLEAVPAGAPDPFVIQLVPEDPWTSTDPSLFPQWEPAVQRWVEGRLLCSHKSFTAEIQPEKGRARLHRRESRAYPLEAVIRVSMIVRLPLAGGLPLHAAGVVLAGRGVAFFGPSGAGKTTLAATSPYPVLSDELVVIAPGHPRMLVSSGFWGEAQGTARSPEAPLAALVALDKGPRVVLEALDARDAARRLVGSVTLPLALPLWSRALPTLGEIVTTVPVYRLEWSPSEPPWDRLAGELGGFIHRPPHLSSPT